MSEGRVIHVLSGAEYDQYIGRAMPRYHLKASTFENQYKVGGKHYTRAEALRLFEEDIVMRLDMQGDYLVYMGPVNKPVTFVGALKELQNKTLACWCAPKDGTPLTLEDPEICHGQVLLRLAKELA